MRHVRIHRFVAARRGHACREPDVDQTLDFGLRVFAEEESILHEIVDCIEWPATSPRKWWFVAHDGYRESPYGCSTLLFIAPVTSAAQSSVKPVGIVVVHVAPIDAACVPASR